MILDLSAQAVALDAAVMVARGLGVGAPSFAGIESIRAAVGAAAAAPEGPDVERSWIGSREGDRLALYGPDCTITATLDGSIPASMRISQDPWALQLDRADERDGVAALTSAIGAGGTRVRVSDGATVTGDWTVSVGGSVDHHDLEAQVEAARQHLAASIEAVGDPEEPDLEPTPGAGTGSLGSGAVGTAMRVGGAVAAGALAAGAGAATRRLLGKMRSHRDGSAESESGGSAESEGSSPGSEPSGVPPVDVPVVSAESGGPPDEQCRVCGATLRAGVRFCTSCGLAIGTGPPPEPPPETPQWIPTHRVPADGTSAWTRPDGSETPAFRLDGGLELRLVRMLGVWAEVEASNRWTGWVDGRRLIAIA